LEKLDEQLWAQLMPIDYDAEMKTARLARRKSPAAESTTDNSQHLIRSTRALCMWVIRPTDSSVNPEL
jgi:hypothetical protein